MNKLKTIAILSFMALLSLGVASCFNPTGPGNGGTGGGGHHGKDTIVHPRNPRDTNHRKPPPRDTLPHPGDTLRKPPHDSVPPPPPPPPPPPQDTNHGGLDTTIIDSLLHH